MNKADILDFFAWLNLIIGSLVAIFFLYTGLNTLLGDTGSILIGVGVFLASLLQFALLGGSAEIIKRLVSIDESLQERNFPQPPSAPTPSPLKPQTSSPEIGRAFRK
jgi:hypothetical protein